MRRVPQFCADGCGATKCWSSADFRVAWWGWKRVRRPITGRARWGAGGVRARPRQAFDKPVANRIDCGHEHNRHGTGCPSFSNALAETLREPAIKSRIEGVQREFLADQMRPVRRSAS